MAGLVHRILALPVCAAEVGFFLVFRPSSESHEFSFADGLAFESVEEQLAEQGKQGCWRLLKVGDVLRPPSVSPCVVVLLASVVTCVVFVCFVVFVVVPTLVGFAVCLALTLSPVVTPSFFLVSTVMIACSVRSKTEAVPVATVAAPVPIFSRFLMSPSRIAGCCDRADCCDRVSCCDGAGCFDRARIACVHNRAWLALLDIVFMCAAASPLFVAAAA